MSNEEYITEIVKRLNETKSNRILMLIWRFTKKVTCM